MKKILAICLALTMLAALASIAVAAEADTDITVKYGKADLALTLIDGFDETKDLPGFMNWGKGKMDNGEIFMECGGDGLYDYYNITTASMKANPTLSGNTYIVFAASNTSDGDVRFTFQPDVLVNGTQAHAYVGKTTAELNPIKLVWKNGKVEDAKFSAQSAGRDVFVIPYEFEGYIIIPHTAIANDVNGTTPVATDGKLEYAGYGLHVAPDDATYVELTLTAAYACSELPAYEAPDPEVPTQPETEAPTEPVTEPATEAPTEVPTEAETDAPTDVETDAPTDAETDAGTEAVTEASTNAGTSASTKDEGKTEEGGCASVIGMSAVAVLVAAAAAVALKKKD